MNWNTPQLITVRAPGGAGKTTLSRVLSQRLSSNSVHLELDDYKPIVDISTGTIMPNESGYTMRDAYSLFHKTLSRGKNIVISECFPVEYKEREYDFFRSAGFREGYDVTSFFLDTPLGVCLERNSARDKVLSDDHIKSIYNSIKRYPTDINIWNNGSIDEVVGKMLNVLDDRRAHRKLEEYIPFIPVPRFGSAYAEGY